MDNKDQITYFGQTDARNRRVTFGIKSEDRNKHMYVIGKTGMGKSTLLENMAVQDIRNGNGFAFMDPHGSAIDTIIQYIPKERLKDVVYFAPFDIEYPVSFNIMEDVGYDKRHLVVSGLMSTFKKIWQDAWSARMEYILGNTLLALLEYPDATLLEVNKMLSDKEFRKKVVDNVTDPAVKSFWVDEFAKYTDRFAAEATPAIQNKIGQFTSNPLIRNIIGQPKSSFDLREVMDNKKILLVNLSKGRVGESNANLLGSMLITKLYLSALSRADASKIDMKDLPNFYVYVDEFQSFANDSFADILSEARKYKLNLTIAHQYIEQMTDEVRAAVFGNVGTMVTFRVGAYDAEVLEKEFAPTFTSEDIVNLGMFQIYLRLMINGTGSQPFSATTIPPLELPEQSYVEEVIGSSRQMYARPRAEIEEFIKNLHQNRSNDGGNSGDSSNKGGGDKKKKSKPAINKNQKKELEDQIDKMKKQVIAEGDDSDFEEVRLNKMVDKTVKKNGKDDGKGPSEENKNSLKSALSSILGDLKEKESKESVKKEGVVEEKPKQEEKAKDPEVKKEEKVEIKKEEQKTEPKKEEENIDSKQEIPEEELRKILEV